MEIKLFDVMIKKGKFGIQRFIFCVDQNVNRPNNPDNDELIQEYVTNNYYGWDIEDVEEIDGYDFVHLEFNN